VHEQGTFAKTPKQVEILELVLAAADTGTFITAKELKSRLSYGPAVHVSAIYCSIDFLVKHGLVIKRRGRFNAIVLQPTLLAYQLIRGS
jgi:Fe2+ or Zn2+ uptake regulation protein